MKRILVVLFSLICFIGYAQTPYPTPYTQQGSPSTLVQVRGGWKADSTAMMPKYVDTITANLYKTKLYAGSIIFTTGDGNYWYRSADAARWLLFGNSVTNCLGTQLISGSITWSGSGLIFDATDLEYSIICTRYSSSATTLTLSTADPTYARIDKLYADITGNVGVITGTPAPNPQEPVINPLSQLDMGIVYIPAGSTVPAGTTQTVIYNENVEWSGTSDVPSINFAYATNPYIGSLSTYIPSAPNSSYVEWQSNGIDYLFSEAQYLKFWVRLNANFVSDPLSFLDVTFEYTDVTVSQTLSVGNGDYNMDYSLINQWQLVSIPLTGLTTFGTDFNEVHFVINSAPTSFQLDYIYLLETATVPPVISSGWSLNLNTGTNPTTNGIGTSDSVGVAIKTNSQTRLIFPANGIVELSNDELDQQLLTIRNDTIYKTNIPTAYGTLPIVVEIRNDSTLITCPTCDTTGGSGWSLTGNAGTNTVTNFIGTTDSVGLRFRTNNTNSGQINRTNFSTGFGVETLNGNTGSFNNAFGWNAGFSNTTGSENNSFGHASQYKTTTGINNNAFGYSSLYENIGGSENNAFGYRALGQSVSGTMNTAMGDSSLVTLTTGSRNTAIGANADVATSSTDSAVAIGYQAVAATKQIAFSPHLTTMFLDLDSASGTAPAIAGIDENGNWRKYATPAGGGSQWTDTTSGIYYADKVGIGGVINPDSTLVVVGSATVSNSLIVGTSISNSGIGSIISGINNTVGTGMNNIVVGVGHTVANNQGANSVFGEAQTMGNSEASTIINGFGNIVGDGANDALVGGTGSSTFASSTIAIGLGNETNAVESISIGGGGNAANGIYSGTFAGTAHEAEDSAAVAIGGQNNSVSGVNAAILGGENNFTSGRNTVVLGGSGINGTMANTTYVDSLRVGGKIVAPNLPTSGTYSKSLAIDASGNIYKKDTLAVSGVYALINANTTGSAATLTTPRLINGVSFNGSADISTDTYLKAIQAMGSTIVAQNIDGTLADASGAISVASQRVYFMAVYLPQETTITGFKWKQSVTGNYTASNYNGGGLYTYSGGTLTLVASSTNDANIWTATVNTIGSKAFSSTYSAAAGLYFVAVTYSASSAVTPPSLGSLVPSSSVNIVNDFTNSAKSSGFISSLTALPSPTQAMSGITATGGEIWVALF